MLFIILFEYDFGFVQDKLSCVPITIFLIDVIIFQVGIGVIENTY